MDEVAYKIIKEELIDKLRAEINFLHTELRNANDRANSYKRRCSLYDGITDKLAHKVSKLENELIESKTRTKSEIHPIKVTYDKTTHKTTVRFLDGSSVTVRRMKGDKHSLHTAVAYALFKKLYPKKLLEELVEGATIIGGRRCKKNCKD